MTKTLRPTAVLAAALLTGAAGIVITTRITDAADAPDTTAVVKLPAPAHDGKVSVENALLRRRSVREFRNDALTLADATQLLWAAQGVTDHEGKRTAPSAGALYPLEVYLVAGKVEGLAPGVYRYRPRTHDLVRTAEGDRRGHLAAAALGQSWIQDGPAVFVLAAVPERTARKYGQRATRYVHIEAGHAAQNIQLQAVARGLGSVVVGAFDDADVQRVLGMPSSEQPICLMPVGRPR